MLFEELVEDRVHRLAADRVGLAFTIQCDQVGIDLGDLLGDKPNRSAAFGWNSFL